MASESEVFIQLRYGRRDELGDAATVDSGPIIGPVCLNWRNESVWLSPNADHEDDVPLLVSENGTIVYGEMFYEGFDIVNGSGLHTHNVDSFEQFIRSREVGEAFMSRLPVPIRVDDALEPIIGPPEYNQNIDGETPIITGDRIRIDPLGLPPREALPGDPLVPEVPLNREAIDNANAILHRLSPREQAHVRPERARRVAANVLIQGQVANQMVDAVGDTTGYGCEMPLTTGRIEPTPELNFQITNTLRRAHDVWSAERATQTTEIDAAAEQQAMIREHDAFVDGRVVQPPETNPPLQVDPMRQHIESIFSLPINVLAVHRRMELNRLAHDMSRRTRVRQDALETIRRLELHIVSGRAFDTFVDFRAIEMTEERTRPPTDWSITGTGRHRPTRRPPGHTEPQPDAEPVDPRGDTDVVQPLAEEERRVLAELQRTLMAGETDTSVFIAPESVSELGPVSVVPRATPELDSALGSHGFW